MKSLISSNFKKFLDYVKDLSSSCLEKVAVFAKKYASSSLEKLSTYLKSLPSTKRYIVLALIAVLVLILIFGLSRCSTAEAPARESTSYIVMVDELEVHKKAKDNSRVLSQLPFALEVDVLEEKTVNETVWGRIDDMELEDGTKIKAGWIDLQNVILPSELIAEQEPEQAPEADVQDAPPAVEATMGTITASKLNIRKGPDEKYETNGAYYKGDRVEILETQTTDGTTWGRTHLGWVGMGYVRMDGSAVNSEDVNPKLVTNGETRILGYGVVDLGELNVRLGPGTDHAKAGTIKKGARYAYYQTSNVSGNWVRIEDGWVSTEYFYLEGTVADDAITGTVNTPDLNIRTGPGTSYRSVGTLPQGESIEIMAQAAGWGYTEQGWVFMSYVEPDAPTYYTGECTVTRGLNIRQEPNADSEIVGTYVQGNTITVLEVDGNWGRTVQGWINLKYVEYNTAG